MYTDYVLKMKIGLLLRGIPKRNRGLLIWYRVSSTWDRERKVLKSVRNYTLPIPKVRIENKASAKMTIPSFWLPQKLAREWKQDQQEWQHIDPHLLNKYTVYIKTRRKHWHWKPIQIFNRYLAEESRMMRKHAHLYKEILDSEKITETSKPVSPPFLSSHTPTHQPIYLSEPIIKILKQFI